jgi:ABC-type sugar transport system ATPase subunit
MPAGDPLLKVEGLTKRFPRVVASADATLEASAKEVHGICGENGAGKSTLIKVLSGAHRPDSGVIRFDGATCSGVRAGISWFHRTKFPDGRQARSEGSSGES